MIGQYKELWAALIILVCVVLTFRKPFYGYLIFIILMFVRPQDDRPLLASYHLPQIAIILTTVSFFFHAVMMKGKSVLPRSKTFGLFILFFAWMVFASFFSSMSEITWAAVNDFLFIVLLFYLTIQIIDDEKKLKILFAVILLCGLHFAYMLQFNGSTMMEQISGESYGRLNFIRYNMNFGQSNYLAFTMNVMFFLSLAMALYVKNKPLKVILIGLCLAYLYTLIQTSSRGASLAFLVTLVFFWFYSKNKIFYVLLFTVIVMFFLPIAKESFPNYFSRLETIKTYEEDSSATDRIILWRTGLDFIKKKPICGIGWDTFGYIAFNSSHNSYIQVASELGIVGFLFWITFMFSSWKQVFSLRKKILKNNFLYFSTLAIELCIIAYIIQSFTSGIAHRELFYFIAAIGCAIQLHFGNSNVFHTKTTKKGRIR